MKDQINHDFDGYDTDYMDAWIKQAVERHQAELEARRAYDRGMEIIKSNNPKPASGYTATITFDLTTVDGAEAWHVHKQAYELHSFAFEVLYNLTKNFERELEMAIERDDDSDVIEILRRLINELSDNYNLNVN